MARTENIVKKLERAGFKASTHNTETTFAFLKSNRVATEEISFYDQNGEAICIRVRDIRDHDDLQSDYFAGSFMSNAAQAIRLADSALDDKLVYTERHESGECGGRNMCGICSREYHAARRGRAS